ncbi:MAG: pentapeptide repeat-containing protein, partial [Candidatus Nanopelagicales bacterium]
NITGQTLSVTNGTWTGEPSPTFGYQWRTCMTADCTGGTIADIAGATSATFQLTNAQIGFYVQAVVTGTNVEDAVAVESNVSAAAISGIAPVNSVAPALTGTPVTGETLSVTDGTWTGEPSPTFSYQWRTCTTADCTGGTVTNIAGATSSTYALTNDEIGLFVQAVVTGTNVTDGVPAYSNVVGPIEKASQTINFTQPPDIVYEVGATVPLTASASSGLTVNFDSNDSAVCTVAGSTVTVQTAGSCSITASQPGNANYLAAPDVTNVFDVGQAAQTITFTLPDRYSLEVATLELTATASSGLPVTYASQTPAVCTVSGATATLLTQGTCTLVASQAGNTSYTPAPDVTASTLLEPLPPQLVDVCSPNGSCAGADLEGLDLAGVNMAGINFTGANFTGANLTGASLRGANLTGTNLTDVVGSPIDLRDTNQTRANFTGANLAGALFANALLAGTNFTGANLDRVDFTKVRNVPAPRGDLKRLTIRQVNFTDASLRSAKFNWMQLNNVRFTDADLRKAKMKGVIINKGAGVRADLRSVNLSNATLRNTNYMQANFMYANLRNTRFINVKLAGANLYKAKLGGAKFTKTSLKKTIRGPGGRLAPETPTTATPSPAAPSQQPAPTTASESPQATSPTATTSPSEQSEGNSPTDNSAPESVGGNEAESARAGS